jgi:hypothetical protein
VAGGSAQLPSDFHDLIDRRRAFTVLALRLADGTVAPRVLVSHDGRIAGMESKERGPGGSPPPLDIREDEVVAARRAGGVAGAIGLGRWHARTPTSPLRPRIRAWSPDPSDRYAHLRPMITFLELRGNKLVHDFGVGSPASRAVLRDPIDFEALVAEFSFPKSVALRPEVDTIACRNTTAEIVGSRGTKR